MNATGADISTSGNVDDQGVTVTTGRLSDDRLEILRMVESHIVSAEEANRLLEALDRTESAPPSFPFPFQPTEPPRPAPPPSPRLIRFLISDVDEDQPTLNLVLPLGMIDSGLKIAKRFAGDLILDPKELRQSIGEGYKGSLLDINDGGQHVQIIVE